MIVKRHKSRRTTKLDVVVDANEDDDVMRVGSLVRVTKVNYRFFFFSSFY